MKIHRYNKTILFAVMILSIVFSVGYVRASDLTSTSFIIRDPVVGTGGDYGSSASFKAYTSGDLTTIGQNSSASFIGRAGFLYYPYATQGAFSTTANGSAVDLAWGATSAGLGWSVSGYSTGKATVSGGPYTYTSVGNVTSYSYTGLTPGQYCFVLRTLDAFSNVIATSSEQCATVTPTLTLAISDASVQFGTLSSAGPRYATTSGGSGTNSVAHTITTSGNGASGYTLTYNGGLLTSGASTIAAATITGDADGTPGSNQFGISLSTNGSASIASGYGQSGPDWKFIAGTPTTIATTSGVTSSETLSVRYLTNISTLTPAGQYQTNITYVLTGNF